MQWMYSSGLSGFFLGYVMCEERKAKAMGKNPASVFWPFYIDYSGFGHAIFYALQSIPT